MCEEEWSNGCALPIRRMELNTTTKKNTHLNDMYRNVSTTTTTTAKKPPYFSWINWRCACSCDLSISNYVLCKQKQYTLSYTLYTVLSIIFLLIQKHFIVHKWLRFLYHTLSLSLHSYSHLVATIKLTRENNTLVCFVYKNKNPH